MRKLCVLCLMFCLCLLVACNGAVDTNTIDSAITDVTDVAQTEFIVDESVVEYTDVSIIETECVADITEPVVETEPVVVETLEVQTEPTVENNLIVTEPVSTEPPVVISPIPNGQAIYLDSRFADLGVAVYFTYPKESDFGVHFEKAVAIYDAIVSNTEAVDILFDIDGVSDSLSNVDTSVCNEVESAWSEFLSIFNQNVLNNTVGLATLQESYYSGKITVWTGRIYSDLEDNVTASNAYYYANLAAGLYNGMSEKSAIEAINRWICNKLSYSTDIANPLTAISTGVGNCAAYSGLFDGMCDNAGIVCERVAGYASSGYTSGPHSWNRVCIDGSWYYVDPCWNDTSGDWTAYLFADRLWDSHSIS